MVSNFGMENVCLLGSAASDLWVDIKRVPVRAFSIHGYQ